MTDEGHGTNVLRPDGGLRVEIADGHFRCPPTRLDIGDAPSEARRGEGRILTRSDVVERARHDHVEGWGLGQGDDKNAIRAALGSPSQDGLLKIAQAMRLGFTGTTNTVTAETGVLSPVTFTATVTGGVTPTGTVTFYDGETSLGTGTLALTNATFPYVMKLAQMGVTKAIKADMEYAGYTNAAFRMKSALEQEGRPQPPNLPVAPVVPPPAGEPPEEPAATAAAPAEPSFTFEPLSTPSSNPYRTKPGNKYAGQTSPLASRLSGEVSTIK